MGPFAAQSRDEPEPYSLPASTISGVPSARYVLAASKIDICSPVGRIARHAAFDAGHERVAQAHVGERAAHHHFVIAAPRAVRVEVVGSTPCAIRYFAAGDVREMLPAGEM